MENARDKGITLIALVITIIILLILAGISITTLTGDNGVLTQANEAKQRTEDSKNKENEILDEYNIYIDEKLGNLPSTSETKPYLPEGAVKLEGTNLNNGLVIKDKNNNEWVWVEVPRSTVFTTAANNTDYTNIENDMIAYASDYRQSGYTDSYYEGNGTANETEYNSLKNKMLSSVYTNGGFWISKYEIGTDTARTNASDISAIPMSQQDKYVYNYVTQKQAQNIASRMKPTNNQTASLVFGIQWDLTLKHIETKGNKTQNELKIDSTEWGNYKNSTFKITKGKYSSDNGSTYTPVSGEYEKPNSPIILTTGATDRNSSFNIYDLAGNVFDWTMEKSENTSAPCTFRGGNYNNNGNSTPAGFHFSNSATTSSIHMGIRVTLF